MAKLDWQRPKYAWERITDEDYLLKQPKSGLPRKPPPMRDPNAKVLSKAEQKRLRKNPPQKEPLDLLLAKNHFIQINVDDPDRSVYVQVFIEHELDRHVRITESTLSNSYQMDVESFKEADLASLSLVLRAEILEYIKIYSAIRSRYYFGLATIPLYVAVKVSYLAEEKKYELNAIECIGGYKVTGKTKKYTMKLRGNWRDNTLPKGLDGVPISQIKNLLHNPLQSFFADTQEERDDRKNTKKNKERNIYQQFRQSHKDYRLYSHFRY